MMRWRSVVASASAAVVVAGFGGGVAGAAGAPTVCPKGAGSLPGANGSALFAAGRSLYACMGRREVRRLGPWSPGRSRLSADGDHATAVWTVRSGGADRVWASRDSRAWLRGVLPSPGTLGAVDRDVVAVRANWLWAAWVTRGGQVVTSVDRPPVRSVRGAVPVFSETDFDEYVFDWTPTAAVARAELVEPAGVGLPQASSGASDGLKGVRLAVARLEPLGLLTPNTSAPTEVIGRWPAEMGERFAASLQITDRTAGDDGSFFVGVEPIAGQPPVGWATGYQRIPNDASVE